jgi:hypothetical protein
MAEIQIPVKYILYIHLYILTVVSERLNLKPKHVATFLKLLFYNCELLHKVHIFI